MSLVVAARVFAAVAVLPLGQFTVRILVAAVFATCIGTLDAAAAVSAVTLMGELFLGASLGLLAGLPVYASRALGYTGAPTVGLLAHTWLWALFFSAGGAGLWISGLAESFIAIPAGDWVTAESIIAAGSAFLYCAILLALPVFLVDLAATPLAGWLDRVGRPGQGADSRVAVRPLLVVVTLVVTLPTLMDMVRDTWWRILGDG